MVYENKGRRLAQNIYVRSACGAQQTGGGGRRTPFFFSPSLLHVFPPSLGPSHTLPLFFSLLPSHPLPPSYLLSLPSSLPPSPSLTSFLPPGGKAGDLLRLLLLLPGLPRGEAAHWATLTMNLFLFRPKHPYNQEEKRNKK